MKRIISAAAVLVLSTAFAGNVFYWQYNYNDGTYHAWNDPANCVIGTCPSDVVLDPSKSYAAPGWELSLEASSDPNVKQVRITFARQGLILLFK